MRHRSLPPGAASLATAATAVTAALLLVVGLLTGLSTLAADPLRDGDPAAGPATASAADPVAFHNVTVIPMDRERTLPDQTVVVRDGRIVAMGPSASARIPDDALRIDGRGRWLMPGLAEMHAHVPPGQDPPRELVEETLFLYVANGITTIRGMLGADYQLPLRDAIARGEVLGPTFYVGAPSINGNSAPTPEAAVALVRAHHEAGYDFLKIHPGVPRDSWDAMVRAAREVGITFGGHVPEDVGIFHALDTGMKTIDHLDGFMEVTRRDGAPVATAAEEYRATDPEKLRALAERLAREEVWLVPTQYLWNNLMGYVDIDAMMTRPEFRYVSPQQRQSWRNTKENRQSTPEAGAAHDEMRQDFLRAAHEAGAAILMGTDSPQLFNVPGFALHRELPLMVDAGMSPYEVLVTGTRTVADYVEQALGQPGDFGTVAPGQRADLVLLAADPLESVENLQARAGVMVRGRWISGEEIDRRLEEIAAKYEG
jgi:imidazolonepropionase-like amidohydrolase